MNQARKKTAAQVIAEDLLTGYFVSNYHLGQVGVVLDDPFICNEEQCVMVHYDDGINLEKTVDLIRLGRHI